MLPLSPTINHAYTNVRVGKRTMRVLTKEAKKWVEDACAITKKAVKEQKWTLPENQWIVAEIYTYFPDKRRRDCHNGCKVLMDGIESAGVVFTDDKWVLPRYMTVDVDKENPRTEVKFYLKQA